MARRTPHLVSARFSASELATIDSWCRERQATRSDVLRLVLGAAARIRREAKAAEQLARVAEIVGLPADAALSKIVAAVEGLATEADPEAAEPHPEPTALSYVPTATEQTAMLSMTPAQQREFKRLRSMRSSYQARLSPGQKGENP